MDREILITEAVLGKKAPFDAGNPSGQEQAPVPRKRRKKRLPWPFRILFWMIGVLLFLSAAVSLYLYVQRDEIKRLIVDGVNSQLQSPVQVQDVQLGIWQHWPMVSVTFKEVRGSSTLESDDEPLFYAQTLSLSFNLKDLYHKRYIVREIVVSGGDFNLKHYGKGENNYKIWKTRENPDQNLRFQLRRILFRNTLVRYRDLPAKHDFQVLFKNVTARGELYSKGQEFDLEGAVDVHSMKAGGFVFLARKEARLDIRLSNNQKSKEFVLDKGLVSIEDTRFGTQGLVRYGKKSPYLEFHFRSRSMQVDHALSLLPAESRKMFDAYRFKGNIAFEMEIKGDYTQGPLTLSAGFDYTQGVAMHRESGIKAENLQLIEEALKELNVVDPQVLIQTKFVEVHMNDLEELGFQYLFSRQNANVAYMDKDKLVEYKQGDKLPNYPISIYQPNTSTGANAPSANWYQYSGTYTNGKSDSSTLPSSFYYTKAPIGEHSVSFGQNAQVVRSLKDTPGGANIQDQAFNFAHYNKYGYKVQATINALDQADSSDMLACPRITTMNGFEAVIAMVTERYFPDEWSEAEVGTIASGNGSVPLFTPSIPEFDETERLGIELRVRPVVDTTDNYTISMTMTPSIRTFIGWTDYSYQLSVESNGEPVYYENKQKMPIIEVRAINTAVQCYDGETIVLGGIIKDTTSGMNDQYPILGTLPLVGRLFQSKTKDAEKINLLIFLTCRLINPDGSPIREREMRGLPSFRY